MSRVTRAALLACLSLSLLVGPAIAGKPIMQRVPINDVAVLQTELSEACGFPVWWDATGHITFRTWLNAADGPVRELNNYAIRGRYYTTTRSVRVNDVGVDRITYLPDGNIIQVIIGNVQSINVPGRGRVYADVGRSTYLIKFDGGVFVGVELLGQSGQHDPDQFAVLCEVLR